MKQSFHQKRSPFSDLVGIKTAIQGKSYKLKIGPRHLNSNGSAHGGAIFTLADRAFAQAVNTKGRVAVAMEMKINYLSPVFAGEVIEARARNIKEGRKTTVSLIEIWRKKELVALVLATAFNIKHE